MISSELWLYLYINDMKSSFYLNICWVQSSVTNLWQKQLSVSRRQYNVGSIDGKQSKNFNDSDRTGRASARTPKQDQQIVSLAEQQTFVTSQNITNQLNRTRVKINERTVRRSLNEAAIKYNRLLLKSSLTANHRKNSLK